MKWVQSFYKDIGLGIFLFLIPFLLPRFDASGSLNTLITATSTIFAIVAGFFIADAMSNYLRLQTLIAEENASLISLADDAKKADGEHYIDVYDAIDGYMIVQLNLNTLGHVFQTEKEMEHIGVAIDALRIQSDGKGFFDHILSMKERILTCRQEISLAAKKNLTRGHWAVLIMLATLVAITVLAVRDGGLISNLVAGLMIVGMQAVLVLLREMDSNHLLENKLAYENPREVFYAVGQPPYYPSFSPLRSRVPNESGLYRLGKGGADWMKEWDLVKVAKS